MDELFDLPPIEAGPREREERGRPRLQRPRDAYRWICGGIGVNYHTLAAFRVAAAELLDELLAQSVAALLATGEVTLARVAHDGVRVRASAGAGSYRGLGRALEDATAQVAALRSELDDDPAATSRRTAAARERAARERESRVRAALDVLPDLEAAKRRTRRPDRPVAEARASTTDPEARVMRMGDGGYRPAYNGQLTTDVASGLVCGVEVTNQGTDAGELAPAVERVRARHGRAPDEVLADGGYVSLANIDDLAACGAVLYAPPPTRPPRADGRARRLDSPAVAAWRARMGTEAAKTIYRLRAATAEWVNALARNRGLQQYRVQGLEKVRSVLLWFALAHNLDRTLAIRAGATG